MVANWLRAAVIAAAMASTACSGNIATAGTAAGDAPAASVAQSIGPAPGRYAGALPDFAGLAEHYGPAVVNVAVLGKRQQVDLPEGMSPNDPFFEFFRRFGQPGQRGNGNVPQARGEGSGFIVSADGYILTNAHVVDNADEVTVKTTDRREYTAKVVGVDAQTDVAVLKIEAKNLPTVRLGDPSKLRPGEWVVAIGSPFGFENSVTAGIQTDVAVNPGNSGGPLFNLDGEVVGINSQIYSRTGGYMGVSFAIPIDVASHVKDQLIKTGRVARSRIGVSIQDVNAQLAESFGLDRPRGALVGMVENDSPGEQGGIKAGDVILKVDGETVETSSQVPVMIAGKKPGTPVAIEVWRNGSPKELSVRPVEIQEKGERVAANQAQQADETARLGLAVRPLTQQEKRQAETDGDLLVEAVAGPAAVAGVRPGDVILGVNGAKVKSMDELRSAAKKRSGKVVALLIERDNAQIFVPVRVG
jgi:serine protease Do